MGFRKSNRTKTEYKKRSPASELDYAIVLVLSSRPMGHREIKRTVEQYLGHSVNKVTFKRHLERMIEHGWVTKHLANWKRGKILLHSLSARSEQAFRMDLYEPLVWSDKKRGTWTGNLSVEQRELRNILFILQIIVVRPPLVNGCVRRPNEGLSVQDILYAPTGLPFGYTELTTWHIINILEKLQKENVIYVTQNNDTKFYHVRNRMASLLAELFLVLDNVILPRIEIALKNTETATYQITHYFESLYGKKNRERNFGKFHDLRMRYRTMKPDEKKKKRDKINKLMRHNDYNLYDIIHGLKEEYSDLMEEQPFLVDAILNAICPPEFGKDSVGKIYPKIVIASDCSSLRYIDRLRVNAKTRTRS